MPGRLVKSIALTVGVLILVALTASLVVRVVGNRTLARARAEVEARWGSLDPGAFTRPTLAEERNAAAWLEAGAAAVVWSDDERKVVQRMSTRPPADWDDEERAVLGSLRDRNAEALATANRALECADSAWDIAYVEGSRARLPGLLQQLQLARLVLASARSDVASGDLPSAIDGAALLGRQAESLEAESVLILGLVGVAVERMELVVLADLAATPGIDHESLDRIEALVLGSDLVDAFRRQLRFEIAATQPVLGPDAEASHFLRAVHAVQLWPLVVARYTRAVAEWMEVAETPLGVRTTEPHGVRSSSRLDPVGHAAEELTPDLGAGLARFQSILSLRQRLRAAVTLRRAALESGAYPDPGTVSVLATPDPFTGRPLEAVRLDDGRLSLTIPGARDIAADRMLESAAATLEPLVLPAPTAESGTSR